MFIYGIEEYSKNEYENMYCDRVIVFNLLRSIIYITIEGRNITVETNPKCDKFPNEIIKTYEDYMVKYEEDYIRYWANVHKEELTLNISVKNIIKYYSKRKDSSLYLLNEKLNIEHILYAENNTVRFYFFLNENGIKKNVCIDVILNDSHILKCETIGTVTINNKHIYEILKNFCNKYFDLLKQNTPISKIIELDMGETINYKPKYFTKEV